MTRPGKLHLNAFLFGGSWWQSGAADGFNVMPPVLPSGLVHFVDHVVPILQRRGLFRSDYEGVTLREHYGLARPPNANLAAPRERVPEREAPHLDGFV